MKFFHPLQEFVIFLHLTGANLRFLHTSPLAFMIFFTSLRRNLTFLTRCRGIYYFFPTLCIFLCIYLPLGAGELMIFLLNQRKFCTNFAHMHKFRHFFAFFCEEINEFLPSASTNLGFFSLRVQEFMIFCPLSAPFFCLCAWIWRILRANIYDILSYLHKFTIFLPFVYEFLIFWCTNLEFLPSVSWNLPIFALYEHKFMIFFDILCMNYYYYYYYYCQCAWFFWLHAWIYDFLYFVSRIYDFSPLSFAENAAKNNFQLL